MIGLAPGALSRPGRVVLFALAYYLLAQLSYSVSLFSAGSLATWWAPSGLALAVLVRADRRSIPWFLAGIFLAAGVVNLEQPIGVVQLLYRSLSDCLEPLASALLLRRRFGRDMGLGSWREVLGFAVIGGLVGPSVGAIIVGLGALISNGSGLSPAMFALVWWGSAVFGAVLFAPVLLTLRSGRELARRASFTEAALLVVALLGVSVGGLFIPTSSPLGTLVGFAAFPLLVWAGIRFGPAGAARAAVMLSLLSLAPMFTALLTLHPWELILGQSLYAVAVLTALGLSALMSETRRLQGRAEAHAAQAEESLALVERALQEARAAVQVREDFLTIASHELKTPLTPIAARLGYLQRKLKAGEPVAAESMDKPIQSLRKLTDLINDLLDASRIGNGRLMIHLEPQPLEDIVRSTVEPFRGSSPIHQILVKAPQEPLWVDADRQRLTQVITNLIDNAIKYSPQGGTVELTLTPHPEGIELVVSDDGIGIPPEQRSQLFERFYRAENSSSSYGGLGLGLYITRDIVDRHGGRIWAESEPGRGARFHVVLPRIMPAELTEALH